MDISWRDRILLLLLLLEKVMYMTDRISVAVLFGGVSSEHEISCISAASVLNHIDRDRYDIRTIGITKGELV
ncbi:MAG: hypothetical protein V8R14_02365 [Clostridia bacterium]